MVYYSRGCQCKKPVQKPTKVYNLHCVKFAYYVETEAGNCKLFQGLRIFLKSIHSPFGGRRCGTKCRLEPDFRPPYMSGRRSVRTRRSRRSVRPKISARLIPGKNMILKVPRLDDD